MSLLVSFVLPDVVEVVSANDECPLHLHALHDAREDTPTDGHVTSEGAFLVNVGAIGRLQEIENGK